MDFLFESRFNALMEGISGQFGTSPLGLLLFILALAALPLFLSLLYLLQKHREKQARTQRIRTIPIESVLDGPTDRRRILAGRLVGGIAAAACGRAGAGLSCTL